MRRDPSGWLLIVGALFGVGLMLFHPTGREIMVAEDPGAQARWNVGVHAVALVTVPALFLGLLGVWRRLAPSEWSTSALVVWALGGVAVTCAAVASGFVATPVIGRILVSEGAARDTYEILLGYTGIVNHGFATVYVIASSVAMLLWSVAIVRTGRLARGAGVLGTLIGAGTLIVFLSGHVGLDVHGFGLITLGQSAWLVTLGALLLRAPTALPSAA